MPDASEPVVERPALLDLLEGEAREFATRLSATVITAFGDHIPPFAATLHIAQRRTRAVVRQEPRTGIELLIDDQPRIRLIVDVHCMLDHDDQYLAVESSTIKVFALGGQNEPLFRYEFERTPTGGTPGAHLHVHAHRDAMTHVMSFCGTTSDRAAHRRNQAASGNEIPRMADMHFPLGGARFRPCLEDVLQTIVEEFGVDLQPGGQQALNEGRERWRLDQLAASVRDAPERAAEALRVLGYTVTQPADGPGEQRTDRLRAL